MGAARSRVRGHGRALGLERPRARLGGLGGADKTAHFGKGLVGANRAIPVADVLVVQLPGVGFLPPFAPANLFTQATLDDHLELPPYRYGLLATPLRSILRAT